MNQYVELKMKMMKLINALFSEYNEHKVSSSKAEVIEFIENYEFGLAFELMIDLILDGSIEFEKTNSDKLLELANIMDMFDEYQKVEIFLAQKSAKF